MTDRRSILKYSGGGLAAFALSAVAAGITPGEAFAAPESSSGTRPLLGNPAIDPVPNPPFPHGLTPTERRHLQIFDTLDFEVWTHQEWDRIKESHTDNVRVHWPDGHYTDGIDKHIEDMKFQFIFAPDSEIHEHYLRIATNELTAVAGVMHGTFSKPMPDGKGGFIPPTGKKFNVSMVTIGIWNKHGLMDEEFLFWDNLSFYQQLGLA